MASGDIISNSVDNLLHTTIISSGMRHNITSDFSLWIRNKHSFNFTELTKLLENHVKHKLTVLEILYQVGFNSKSSFNTAFKIHIGLTPTQYRKRQLGKVN